MSDLRKSTIIEAVASTMDTDSQGEILDIDGADITPLTQSIGFCNSDHMPGFANLVGHVIDAHKVMKAEDAKTPFQMKEWQRLQRPFISMKAEIWDQVGHKEADAIGAIYKHYSGKGQPSPIKVSVEGKVLSRGSGKESHILKKTLIRGIAITVQPANKSTSTEVVQITKSMGLGENHFAKSAEPRSFTEIKYDPLERLHQLALVANQMLKSIKDK